MPVSAELASFLLPPPSIAVDAINTAHSNDAACTDTIVADITTITSFAVVTFDNGVFAARPECLYASRTILGHP